MTMILLLDLLIQNSSVFVIMEIQTSLAMALPYWLTHRVVGCAKYMLAQLHGEIHARMCDDKVPRLLIMPDEVR